MEEEYLVIQRRCGFAKRIICYNNDNKLGNAMKKTSIITHLIIIQFIFTSVFISQSFFIDIKGETEIGTHINANTTWDKNGSPYIIKTDTIITEGNTVTIEAGVEIKFEKDTSLEVNGNIQVLGTLNNPVIFTSNMGSPYIGNWEGIILKNSSNRLEYFYILYSEHGLKLHESSNNIISNGEMDYVENNGITLIRSDNNNIDNITISITNEPINDTKGIFTDGSSYNKIVDCTINNGSYGIYLDYGRNNNVIRCTTPICHTGIEIFQSINCVLDHCDVSDSINGIKIDTDNCEISNNTCDSNQFMGIELRGLGNKLRSNRISNCENWSFRFDGSDVEDYYNDIDTSNTINGKSMYIFQNKQNLIINSSFGDFGYLGFISCSNITVSGVNNSEKMHDIIFVNVSNSLIKDNNFSNNYFGLLLVFSYDNRIQNNYFFNTSYGISLIRSSDNVLNRNSIIDSKYGGIHLHISKNNYITESNIRNTHCAFDITLTSDNIFHHNNIINCTNIFEPDSWASQEENLWNGPMNIGNYWDNYQGQDTNNDGIGDTEIPHEGVDYYPLMNLHIYNETPNTPPEINDMWFSTNETYYYVDFCTYVNISDFEIDSEYLILTRFYIDDELLNQIPKIKYEGEGIWNITWIFPDNAYYQLGLHRIGVIFKDPMGYQSEIKYKEIKIIDTPYNFVEFETEKLVYDRCEKLKVVVNATEYSSDYCSEENLNLSVSVNYIFFSIYPQPLHIWHWPDLPDTKPEIIENSYYNYTSKRWETVFNLTRTMGIGNYSIGCYLHPFQWQDGDYRYKKFIIAPFNITILNNNPRIISFPEKFTINKEQLEVNLTPYMYDTEGLYVMVREYNESDAMSSWIYNFRGEWIESNMKSVIWELDQSSVNKSLCMVNITDINNNTLTIHPVDNKVGYDEIILNLTDIDGGFTNTMVIIEVNTRDTDSDGIPDYLDPDDDNDSFLDEWEEFLGTNPKDPNNKLLDTDSDGIPDGDVSNSQPWMDIDDDNDSHPDNEDDYPTDPDKWKKKEMPIFEDRWVIGLIVVILILVAIVIMAFLKKKRGGNNNSMDNEKKMRAKI